MTIRSKNRYILNFNSYCQIPFQKGCSNPHSLLQSVWLHRDCCGDESCLPAWVTPGYQNSEEAQMGFHLLISFHEGMTPWHPYLKKWLPWQLPLWGLLWLGKHVCMNYGSSSCFFPSLCSHRLGGFFSFHFLPRWTSHGHSNHSCTCPTHNPQSYVYWWQSHQPLIKLHLPLLTYCCPSPAILRPCTIKLLRWLGSKSKH